MSQALAWRLREGRDREGGRNLRVPEWGDAERSCKHVACLSARTSGRGLWEPFLKSSYG